MSKVSPRVRFYTIPNSAKMLGVSRQRIHTLIKAGQLNPTKIEGIGRVISSQEILRFQQRRNASKPTRRRGKTRQLARGPVAPPVQTFPSLLPLNDPNFTWQQFETFCEAFLSILPNVKKVHFYGRRGGRQKGIDFIADMENGQHWTFQARQVRKFNKTHVQKTISETKYDADRHVLLITSQAGSNERDVCTENGKWDIWDIRDISRKVQSEIPPTLSAQLVEKSFGAQWRNGFLGLPGLSALVAPKEYFRPLLDPTKLFHHDRRLVGRAETIAALNDLIDSRQNQVAILSGRGGIGKSKILHAFTDQLRSRHREYTVLVLVDGVPLDAGGFDQVPVSPLLLVADDAHRAEGLAAILSFAQQRRYRHPNHPIKLVLAIRPQGVSRVSTLLTQANFDSREIVRVPEIKELSRENVKELASQVLGKKDIHLADRLAAATWDSPLVTVVGGRLLSERRVDPVLLANDDEFRRVVLTRFEDVILGSLSGKIDPNMARRILRLIAALGPVNFGNDAVVERSRGFLQMDHHALLRAVGLLEDYGILVRRGRTVRVTPDVLADHLLQEACLNSQGVPTGYAYRLFRDFADSQPANVLRNLAELDWRTHRTIGESGLLETVWEEIKTEFQNSPHSGRCRILDILEDVAYYQPRQVLDITDFATRSPAQTPESSPWARLYKYSHKDVLDRVPKLLRRISFNLDYLPQCCDRLWELGRDDTKDLNPNPDHPVRVLTDLAGYDIDKPLAVQEAILSAVTRWLSAPDAHGHHHSPLDVIAPFFAKTSYSTLSEGHSIVFRPFKIHHENTKSLRTTALELIVACSRSPQIRVVFKALQALEEALRGPMGFFGQEITAGDMKLWVPERLAIIDILARIAQESDLPLVQLRIIEILQWYTKHEGSKEVRARAQAVRAGIKTSRDTRAFSVLKDRFDLDLEDDENTDYAEKDRAMAAIRRSVAQDFLNEFQDSTKGFLHLNQQLSALLEANVPHNASPFLYEVSQMEPVYAAQLCDSIVRQPETQLSTYLAVLLSGVRKTSRERFGDLIERALKTDSPILWRSVADGYRIWLGEAPDTHDISTLRQLLAHQDQIVRSLAVFTLHSLARIDQQLAKELALSVDINGNATLAERISELFQPKYGIPFENVSDDELKSLIRKLESVPDLDNYDISEFLSNASERIPIEVVQLFLDRIAKAPKAAERYRPIPFRFHHRLQGLAQSREYGMLLRRVRDLAIRKGWSARHWGAELFKEVSLGYSPQSLTVLDEWIDSRKASKIEAAASLLREADPDFVFDNRDFAVRLLQKAHEVGDECMKKVQSHLFASAASGGRSGVPGEPFPQDVALRDRAAELARELAPGSPEQAFYRNLSAYAESEIRQHLAEDEEMFA